MQRIVASLGAVLMLAAVTAMAQEKMKDPPQSGHEGMAKAGGAQSDAAVIAKATALDASKRYPTADPLADDLDRFLRPKQRRWVVAAACLVPLLPGPEAPTNPYLYVVDLEQIVAIATHHRLRTMIDSTFATPYNQNPLDFGIDLVMHSATKYLGGHNDLMAGVIAGSKPMISALREAQGVLGGITDPNTAYLLLRGIKTFALRMQQHNANGCALAAFLETHQKMRRVYYPGLTSHPSHAIARQQMRGFGGVVSFEIDGTLEQTSAFIDALRIPYIAPSLGGVESLVEQPALMSYYELTPEERQRLGISDALVRYAAGIEDTDDLLADVEQALKVCL